MLVHVMTVVWPALMPIAAAMMIIMSVEVGTELVTATSTPLYVTVQTVAVEPEGPALYVHTTGSVNLIFSPAFTTFVN